MEAGHGGSRADGPMLRDTRYETPRMARALEAEALRRLRDRQVDERRQLAVGYREAAAALEQVDARQHAAAIRLLCWEAEKWER